jgi:integrase
MKYFDDKYLNKTNNQQMGRYNLHMKPIFGNKSINDIKHEDIDKLRRSLIKAQKAAKTINGIIQLLSVIFNNAKATNPCKDIKKLKEDDRRERYLTKDEVSLLFENIQDNPQMSLFAHLALNTGGRLETILHIQKKDINISNSSLVLHDLKSSSTYTGFIGENLKAILSPILREMQPNDYIVGGKDTKAASRTVRRHFKEIFDRLFNEGLDSKDAKNRVVIHTLRHTFASQLAINGTSLFIIQKLLNHKDITHTQRYAKLAPDSGQEAVRNLFG